MRGLGSRLLDLALCVLVTALLLTWAWHLIRPLVPVAIAVLVVVIATTFLVRRLRSW